MQLPMNINIDIPYKSQLDNTYEPWGSCNVTSYAMVAAWLGIKPQSQKQLEDEFWQWLTDRGLNPQSHADLIRLARAYGITATFTTTATWSEVRSHLAQGKPVIVAGYTTASGHIFVIRGFNELGYWVNDPYGEYFSSGYDTSKSGENLHYSQALMDRCIGVSGDVWCHFIDSAK